MRCFILDKNKKQTNIKNIILPATVENPPIMTACISDSVRSTKYGLMIIGASV